MRYCDTAPGDASKPLVVLMHGWPESWFSWRHQLASLDAAGYRAVAPDLRGFGGTDAPADTADYGVAKRTGDMKALLDHLETDDAAFVGHDHGAFTGWLLAQLEPEIVRCYYALSVPVRAKRRPVTAEVDYVVDEYERNGWEGGLHWYKTMDPDWEATPQLKGDGRKLKVPAGFLAGTEDLVVDMFGGVEKITADLKATCAANDPPITFLEGGGHWIQQERPGDVNEKLLELLAEYN
ncbi:10-hydroxy-9-(phosphonooxy)octadecanoate phosphatase [Aureococcus anophagefferens]|nr:10-hydroxy-9-(phosphonooxy)octadecanoate phosphatase [Aureococcus anophagefferens]